MIGAIVRLVASVVGWFFSERHQKSVDQGRRDRIAQEVATGDEDAVITLIRESFDVSETNLPMDLKTIADRVTRMKKIAMGEVLSAHPWAFATEETPAVSHRLTGTGYGEYRWEAATPDGCLRIVGAYGRDGELLKWERLADALRANGEIVRVKYVRTVEDLENFIVKRSGCITKRRGSDEIADLTALMGASAKLIPLCRDRNLGHYVLLTGGRAYLLSRNGILLSTGAWARSVPAGGSAYSVEVPYGDNELSGIDWDQSGDTLFLAHRNHPPATLVRTGDNLTYRTLAFATRRWQKPRVLKVENGGGTWGSGASKTVYYACTYVKDGVESEMSDPVGYTYRLPWGNGCTVNITCDRGNNADEPDYYNIYKKDSTEYGLIACEGKKVSTGVSPSATIGGATGLVPRLSHDGTTANVASSANDYVGSVPASLLVSSADGTVTWRYKKLKFGRDGQSTYTYTSRTRTVANYESLLVGGVKSGSTLTFSFGSASGTRVSDLTLALDAFEHTPYAANYTTTSSSGPTPVNDYDAFVAYGGATYFVCRITTADYGGTTRTFTRNVTVGNPQGLTPSAGKVFWTSKGSSATVSGTAASWSGVTSASSAFRRTLAVSFFSEINAAYGSKSWQTNAVEITAYTASDGSLCNLYWHGVAFGTSKVEAEVFQDDYITPDLTSTPPTFSDRFTAMGDYPGCVGVYKQRLCFASTANEPFTFWMSCVGDLYNFSTHDSIREDDAIEATIAATEFPDISHMVVNRDLLVLSDGGEWKVAPVSGGNTLSYRTISADKQSAIGSAPDLKPLVIGDEIVFAERTGSVLRATRYSVLSEGYETQDLSVLSSDVFRNNPIVSMAYQQSPDSIVWCVLADGTLASLVYMKEHEMVAWSHHTLGGDWQAVAVATNKSFANGATETVVLVRAHSAGDAAGSGREIELEPEFAAEGDGIGFHTGLVRKTVYGDNRRDGRLVLEHRGVWPITVLSLATTYQVELANQTTGGDR